MKYLIAAALLLCIPTPVVASDVSKSIVRVYVHGDNDCSIDYYGSGFLVSSTQVLTNWHVVKDRRKPVRGKKCAIQLRFHDGCRVYATVVSQNKVWDIALLRIKEVDYPVLELGERPIEGQTAFVHGTGSDYEYRSLEGKVGETNLSPMGAKGVQDLVQIEGAPSRQGDSGGPITDINGRVIGILNATDDTTTNGIMVDRIEKVLKGKLKTSKTPDYSLRGSPSES